MQRIVVVGVSGSGKSTLARALASSLGLESVELDALFHGPGWTERADFIDDVEVATRADAWVVDGNYSQVRDVVWTRADTIVWLDLPRPLVMRQVIWRTVSRWALRAELWNGNRERARTWLRASHPIRWAWAKHPEYRQTYIEALARPEAGHLAVHRLMTRTEVAAFLALHGDFGRS